MLDVNFDSTQIRPMTAIDRDELILLLKNSVGHPCKLRSKYLHATCSQTHVKQQEPKSSNYTKIFNNIHTDTKTGIIYSVQ